MIIQSFTVNRSKTRFFPGISRNKIRKEKKWLLFSSLVAHRSIADEGRPCFLLNSGTFLVISLRFTEFPGGLVVSWFPGTRNTGLPWSRSHQQKSLAGFLIKEGAFVRYMAEVRALPGLCIVRTSVYCVGPPRANTQHLPSTILQKKTDSIFWTSICPASQRKVFGDLALKEPKDSNHAR